MAKKKGAKKKTSQRRAGRHSGSSRFKAIKESQNIPLPDEFIKRIKHDFGDEAERLIDALDGEAITAIRFNCRTTEETEAAVKLFKEEHPDAFLSPIPWCSTGFYLDKRIDFTLDPLHHAGLYYVQEPASMIIGEIASKINTSGLWLDMCAAPGGKSTHIAKALGSKCIVVANEADAKRTQALIDNVVRMGLSNLIVTTGDGREFGKLSGEFDAVSIDAPCSGEGMFRKDHKSRSEWSERKVKECSALQKELIEAGRKSLRANGQLLYSTCTFAREENELQFGRIKGLSMKPLDLLGVVNEDNFSGYTKFIPGRMNSEGFYLEAEIRKEVSTEKYYMPESNLSIQSVWKDKLPEFIKTASDHIFIYGTYYEYQDRLWLSQNPSSVLDAVSSIPGCQIKHLGIAIAEKAGERWLPHHHLATSGAYKDLTDFAELELDKEQALKYLRGESLNIEGAKEGFVVLNYKSLSLGLGKALPTRINNLYPKYLRIKKRI